MTKPLKPVSDAMRRALALLGETPDDHQREKIDQRVKTPKKMAFTTKALESSASVAARLVAKIPPIEWRADARVLFTRTRTCRNCESTVKEMHHIETFIRQRSTTDPKTLRYIPARSALFATIERLPRLLVDQQVKTFYCPSCWADERPLENPVCLSELVTLPPESTESSSDSAAPTNGSAGTSTSSPSAASPEPTEDPASSPISPSIIEALGSVLSSLHGSTFESFGDDKSADAQLTPIPTA